MIYATLNGHVVGIRNSTYPWGGVRRGLSAVSIHCSRSANGMVAKVPHLLEIVQEPLVKKSSQ